MIMHLFDTQVMTRIACSVPGKQRVATSCMLVHAVLTAVLEWANYEPVVMASVDCLRTMLHFLGTGKYFDICQYLPAMLLSIAFAALRVWRPLC